MDVAVRHGLAGESRCGALVGFNRPSLFVGAEKRLKTRVIALSKRFTVLGKIVRLSKSDLEALSDLTRQEKLPA
jgi:hypothetical protein